MNWEQRTHLLLDTGTALDVLYLQMSDFEVKFGHPPALVLVSSELRPAIVKAIMVALKAPASAAVANPLIVNSTVVSFTAGFHSGKFMELTGTRREEYMEI